MSQPARPSYSPTPIWAPNVAYPSGTDPWSNTPTKVSHPGAASVGIVPKTGVGAQVFNGILNSITTDGQAALGALQTEHDYTSALAARSVIDNWPGLGFGLETRLSTKGPATCGCYDESTNAWYVVCGGASGFPGLYVSFDQGASFALVADQTTGYGMNTVGESMVAMGSDGAGSTLGIWLHQTGGNASAIWYNVDAAGTITVPGGTSNTLAPGLGNVSSFHFDAVRARFDFFAAPQPGAATANAIMFSLRSTSTLGTAVAPPTPTGTLTNISKCITARKRGTNEAVYFARQQSGAGFAYMLHMGDFGDQTAASWTWHAAPYSGSSAVCNGLTYSEANGVYMVAYDAGGATSYATSSDGQTWTPTAGTTPTGRLIVNGLKAVGKLWMAKTVSGTYVSADNGASWTLAHKYITVPHPIGILAAPNGSQLLMLGDTVRASLCSSML